MPQPNSPHVKVQDLSVRYGYLTALDQLTFQIEEGSFFALLGRNGAGKSSFIRCLLGHQQPTEGQISHQGLDVWEHRTSLMSHTGVVSEADSLPREMSPQDLSLFLGRLNVRWQPSEFLERIGRFKIPPNQPYGALSKGQKKLVAISVALGTQPSFLVLDDPTLGLDMVAKRYLFDELIGILAEHKVTVLMATHDIDEVERIATHVGILKNSRLALSETLESLKKRFRRIATERESSLTQFSVVQKQVRGWQDEYVISDFEPNLGTHYEVSPISLTDIFLALTSDEGNNP